MPTKVPSAKVILANSADAMVSADGTALVVEYDIGGDDPLRLALPFDTAKELFAKMSYAASASTPDKTAVGGQGFVRMTPVTGFDVGPLDVPGHILLCLLDELNIPHYFSIPIQASAELRPRLRTAEAEAKRGVLLGRA
ncbi:hypothetical protein [Sinorhizobium meliloti]|uniref:hypothetical protein n=1 Tax=Rhizobium meliloti TaxID=382 RepID=UPI00209133A6|nr:hypothetical protein [Sinorhizobium meliloti]MCO5962365.1 hypothetical protein [Sinorhizobium meliloti]